MVVVLVVLIGLLVSLVWVPLFLVVVVAEVMAVGLLMFIHLGVPLAAL